MNFELLEKVAVAIEQHPLNLEMINSWITHVDDIAECNTAGCIAGWVVAMGSLETLRELPSETFAGSTMDKAQTILGLTGDQTARLFFVNRWPEEFRFRHGEGHTMLKETRIKRTEVAVERIRHFIKTEGKE